MLGVELAGGREIYIRRGWFRGAQIRMAWLRILPVRFLVWALAVCAPLLLASCATPPKDPAQRAAFDQTNDPLEPMNRAIFDFNDKAYTYVLFPIARGYNDLPGPARTGIHSALVNLNEPVVFMNKTLQGDASSAVTAVGRFLINSIFGFGGLIDVASHNKIQEPQAADFGATLYSLWGGRRPLSRPSDLGPQQPARRGRLRRRQRSQPVELGRLHDLS